MSNPVVLERDIFGTPIRWGRVEDLEPELPEILGSDLPDAVVTHLETEAEYQARRIIRQEAGACILEAATGLIDPDLRTKPNAKAATAELQDAIATYVETGIGAPIAAPWAECWKIGVNT